jgi:hypothetical protein
MLMSSRLKSGAPKPNTNFLRHIIRQTDSHNAALLAREADESNARLKDMNRERIRTQKNNDIRKARKADGRLTPVLSDEEAQDAPDRRGTDRGEGGRKRRRSVDLYTRRHRSRSRESRHEKRKREDSDDERSSRRSKRSEHHRDRRHRDEYTSEDEESRPRRKHKSSRRRQRSSSRSTQSRSPSRSSRGDRAGKKRRHRDRSPSPERSSRHRKIEKSKRRSPDPVSDSDPLEAIVGPLPPNVQPNIRSRGRGAHKANSMGMDSRFSAAYDPALDARPPSDAEGNWGENVEAFRDRQRWKQQGAERLKAAGFTDEQVKKWEKGDNKDEEDVTWTKRGQAREWDRGKVVDEDGDVELKAEWGRLK